ncbi:MAG TPA: nucleotide exchange factor GrpE [Kofleriaceae bacterium]|nr:nucleotide exchange factor GrpE [Kofleriaceae bacterium]
MQSPVIQALADLEAAKARVDRDAARVKDELRAQLVAELLPVLDNLDRSIAAGGEKSVVEGVRLVRSQLMGVLQKYGLERFDVLGDEFDPRRHDAMSVVDTASEALDGVVIDQWEPGYRIGDKLLRPARVVVGRAAIARTAR